MITHSDHQRLLAAKALADFLISLYDNQRDLGRLLRHQYGDRFMNSLPEAVSLADFADCATRTLMRRDMVTAEFLQDLRRESGNRDKELDQIIKRFFSEAQHQRAVLASGFPRRRLLQGALSAASAGALLLVGLGFARHRDQCRMLMEYYNSFLPLLRAVERTTEGLLTTWRSLEHGDLLEKAFHDAIAKAQQQYWRDYQTLMKDWDTHDARSSRPYDWQLESLLSDVVGKFRILHIEYLQRLDEVGRQINGYELHKHGMTLAEARSIEAKVRTDLANKLLHAEKVLQQEVKRSLRTFEVSEPSKFCPFGPAGA